MQAFAKALEDPRFPDSAAFLLDVTRSESLSTRPTDDLRSITEFMGRRAGKIGKRCAILATTDLHYGLMRMAGVFAEEYGVEVKVFRRLEEALDWLGVRAPQEF
jgi:hypothetical protein